MYLYVQKDKFKVFICYIYIVILSLCGIKRNENINEENMTILFNKMNINDINHDEILSFMNKCSRDENNNIKVFSLIENLKENQTYIHPLIELKKTIIDNIIGKTTYLTICRRKYYLSHREKDDNTIPTEKCLDKIERILFTNNPPPFFYQYEPDESFNESEIFQIIKNRYEIGSSVFKSRRINTSTYSSQVSSFRIIETNRKTNQFK